VCTCTVCDISDNIHVCTCTVSDISDNVHVCTCTVSDISDSASVTGRRHLADMLQCDEDGKCPEVF